MRLLPRCLASAVLAALLGACASGPTTPASGVDASRSTPARAPTANPATRAAATKANLAVEKLRLSELFRGTPVLFVLQPDGSLRADVPMQYAFDPGKATVKAPLAAVLDRIAAGQVNELTQLVVAAPADPGPRNPALAAERAANARTHLIGRGLAEARVTASAAAVAGAVRVVVGDAPAPQ